MTKFEKYLFMIKGILILTFLSICLSGLGQNKFREIIVSKNDTIIKCKVLNNKVKYKPAADTYYFWYRANDVHKNLGGYDGLLLTEDYCVYVNNNLVEKGYFKNGVKIGEWRNWNTKGEVEKVYTYRNGLLHGACNYYYSSALVKTENYKRGILHGKVMSYENDTVIVSKYRKGVLMVKNIPDKKEKDKPEAKTPEPGKERVKKEKKTKVDPDKQE